MMNLQQAISNPFGVNTFGSAIIRVEPDIASLNFTVSRLEQHPRDAFQQAREAAQVVRSFLGQTAIDDVQSSRIDLFESFSHSGGVRSFEGYRAEVTFHSLLRELNHLEEILVGAVDSGVNNIGSVDFQTSRLKEIRAEARKRAIRAAREKAELYCEEGGVSLGSLIHIEDVNPDQLKRYQGHAVHETKPDDEGPLTAFDPGSIVIGAAVMLSFEIDH